MIDTVYLVVSSKTGAVLNVYSTLIAAQADCDAVNDGREVASWTVHDGYTIGRYRP